MKENIPLQSNEEIRLIQGYEGLYSITSYGRVYSHRKIRKFGENCRVYKAKFLKLYLEKKGYLRVNLHKFNKIISYRVHRLVAQAFISNPLKLS